jgi:hypothetical protein
MMAAKKECTLRPPEPEAQDEKEVAAEGWTQRPPPLYWVLLTRAWSLRTTAGSHISYPVAAVD